SFPMTTRRALPKVRDSISFLYFEHCRIEQDVKAIAIFQEKNVVPTSVGVPRSLMLLGRPRLSCPHERGGAPATSKPSPTI
ncbi:CRISPR-associated protein Cas1, partial [uncultured Leptolyngbya sp.]